MTESRVDGTAEALALVCSGLSEIAEQVVPWFYSNMPAYYLRTHSITEKVQHLQGIISGKVFTEGQTVRLENSGERKVTYILSGERDTELLEILQVHAAESLETARVYTSLDGRLRLVEFMFTPQPRASEHPEACAEAIAAMQREGLEAAELHACRQMLGGVEIGYVEKFDPKRTRRHLQLLDAVGTREDTALLLEETSAHPETRLVVAMRNPPTVGLLLQALRILIRHGVTLHRCYGDSFVQADGGTCAIMSFYLTVDGGPLQAESALWQKLRRALQLVKWFAPDAFETYADNEGWALRRVMLVSGMCEFAHVFLVQDNQWAYSTPNVVRILQTRRAEVALLVNWFEARFDPHSADREELARRLEAEALESIGALADEQERAVLLMAHRFIAHVLRTNYFLDDIYGLSFRLDPQFLPPHCRMTGEELPYGIFFFHGPHAQGFHIRYRDMARGGVRVVRTRSHEQFELESNRLYDEVKGLALAQQVKNKDIPEGGAKAVILLAPLGSVHLAVASVINSLLDVILCSEDSYSLPGVVDYLGKEEIIYLGPDENITPENISWIVNRARERDYRWPSAFMSSKPGAGINHKEYGVTSLGVMVFADEVLRYLGIDPHSQPFSISMTGGPKGDVAGNLMRIMFRDYAANARVVSVADGHGAAYDPEGLDGTELLRLVDEQRSIDAFSPALLRGQGAFVVSTGDPAGARLAKGLHNMARADVFIPAGGRPDTMNMRNWHEFFDAAGLPAARAIVEGANLFVSPEARQRLSERGVLVVHGSSANKTGVICSSYEVLGGLVMDDAEFMAVKERFVEDVFVILRDRARSEARLLLSELRRCDRCKPLPVISVEASQEMNHAADAMYEKLMEQAFDVASHKLWSDVVYAYCPAVLVQRYRGRILERIPRRHLYALIAAYVSSTIVYAEGMGWLGSIIAQRDVMATMRIWLEADARMKAYAEAIRDCGMADATEAGQLLVHGGRRRSVLESLQLV